MRGLVDAPSRRSRSLRVRPLSMQDKAMSALPLRADMPPTSDDVGYGPKADMAFSALRKYVRATVAKRMGSHAPEFACPDSNNRLWTRGYTLSGGAGRHDHVSILYLRRLSPNSGERRRNRDGSGSGKSELPRAGNGSVSRRHHRSH